MSDWVAVANAGDINPGEFRVVDVDGANVVVPIASQEYGMREFHIEDLNGYRIAIAEETDDV